MIRPKLSKLWKNNIMGDNMLCIVWKCKDWTDTYGNQADNPFHVGRATSHIISPNRVIVQQDGVTALMYYKNFALHGEILKEKLHYG